MSVVSNDDEYEVLSGREQAAARAARATVFGLVCPPILIYALVLLLKAYFMPGRLEGRHRKHLTWVSCLAGVVVLFIVLSVVVFLRGPPGPVAELRALAHPDVLVGTWEGTYAPKEGKTRLVLRLSRNGDIDYRETGAIRKHYTGAWAYDNHTFLICYDRADPKDDPMTGEIFRFDTEGIHESEMVLRLGPDMVRMVRTK